MLFIEDEIIKLGGVILSGQVKSVEITQEATIDEIEDDKGQKKASQPVGYGAAKITIDFILEDGSKSTLEQIADMQRLFKDYSGAKDNYLFRYYITINELTEQLFARYHTVLVIVNYNYLMLDGSWNLDGAQILSGVIRNFKVSVESNIQMLGVDEKLTNLKHIVEHNYWTLNGQVLLDGNRNLDAYRYEEEIL